MWGFGVWRAKLRRRAGQGSSSSRRGGLGGATRLCPFFFLFFSISCLLQAWRFGLAVASGGQIIASCLRWHYYSWWGCCCSGEMCSLGVQHPNCSLRMWENKPSCMNTRRRCHSPQTGADWNTNFYHLPDSTSASSVKWLCGDIWGPRRTSSALISAGGRQQRAGKELVEILLSVCDFWQICVLNGVAHKMMTMPFSPIVRCSRCKRWDIITPQSPVWTENWFPALFPSSPSLHF